MFTLYSSPRTSVANDATMSAIIFAPRRSPRARVIIVRVNASERRDDAPTAAGRPTRWSRSASYARESSINARSRRHRERRRRRGRRSARLGVAAALGASRSDVPTRIASIPSLSFTSAATRIASLGRVRAPRAR
jgi:hypothetical protein